MRKIVWSALVAALLPASAGAQATGRFDVQPVDAQAAQTPASGSTATPAQAAAAPAPAPKRLTLTVGSDVPSAYMFRGIFQEDEGFIFEPAVDLGIALYQGQGALTSVSADVGNWDSIHSGPSGSELHDNAWYESDYYGSVTFTYGKFKPGLLFTDYTSPADAFHSVQELAGVFSYDDSAAKVPFSPKAVLAFELDGQADGGSSKGVYLELGVRPTIKLAPKFSLGFPIRVGLSLHDYYEGVNGSDAFGYLDTGAIASVPLPSTGKVNWEIHGGFDVLTLGDNMKALNHDDRGKFVPTIGFTMTY
jgi:hypothetical protein